MQQRTLVTLNDTNEEYYYEEMKQQKRTDKKHDKLFKILFSNKKETAKFINKHLGLEGTGKELKAIQMQKCNTEFITKNMEKLQSDILYKIKGTKTYILIEHQSTVDYRMAIRILEYCVEIINEEEKQIKPNYREENAPTVYPIVLYTGKERWKAKTELTQMEKDILGLEKMVFAKYNLIDVNNYTIEELLNEECIITNAMALEKARDSKETVEIIEKILTQNLNDKEKPFFEHVIITLLENKIGKEKTKEVIEKIKKGGDNMVIENLERIWDDTYNSGLQKGLQNGIRQVAIQLVKNKISNNTIKKVTKLTDKELEEIKREMTSKIQ